MRLAGIYRLRIHIVIRCRIRYGIPASLAHIMSPYVTARLIRCLRPLYLHLLSLLILCRIWFAGLILQIVQSDLHQVVAALMELYYLSA